VSNLILKGVVTGFILSVMLGPIFFVLIETSIRKGIRAAVALDVGVFFSDLIYILIAFFFYNEVKSLADGQSKEMAKIVGGCLFIAYGLFTFFKKPTIIRLSLIKERKPADWKEYRRLSLKGFLLNLANPLIIFYWFSVLSYGDSNHVDGWNTTITLIVFIGIILSVFFSIDFLKIIGAKQLRPFITNRLLIALNHLIGMVFIAFGIFLLIQGIWNS